MPYEKTGKKDSKGRKLYRTPSGVLVTQSQIGAIESKKHGRERKKGHGRK